MTCLPDVNVLFALAIAEHPHNPSALRWWNALPVNGALLALPVQMGVLRLLTNPAIMGDDILTPSDAWNLWVSLKQDERTSTLVALPDRHEEVWRRLATAHKPSRGLWTDGWLAAVSETLGLMMVTFDRGFRKFDLSALELLTASE